MPVEGAAPAARLDRLRRRPVLPGPRTRSSLAIVSVVVHPRSARHDRSVPRCPAGQRDRRRVDRHQPGPASDSSRSPCRRASPASVAACWPASTGRRTTTANFVFLFGLVWVVAGGLRWAPGRCRPRSTPGIAFFAGPEAAGAAVRVPRQLPRRAIPTPAASCSGCSVPDPTGRSASPSSCSASAPSPTPSTPRASSRPRPGSLQSASWIGSSGDQPAASTVPHPDPAGTGAGSEKTDDLSAARGDEHHQAVRGHQRPRRRVADGRRRRARRRSSARTAPARPPSSTACSGVIAPDGGAVHVRRARPRPAPGLPPGPARLRPHVPAHGAVRRHDRPRPPARRRAGPAAEAAGSSRTSSGRRAPTTEERERADEVLELLGLADDGRPAGRGAEPRARAASSSWPGR